ncbi:hypothetical protein CR513_22236, partial [Mucuna pruriens]
MKSQRCISHDLATLFALLDCRNNVGLLEEFILEHDIATFNHDSLSISNFYSQFMNLWAKYTDIMYARLTSEGLSSVQIVHETTKRDQFLMKLKSNFESIQSNLMHRDLVPSLDACLNDLLREEQHLLAQPLNEEHKSSIVPMAYVAHEKSRCRDLSVQCFCCKQFGHYASSCSKKFCNYCKNDGHTIKEFPTRPPRQIATTFTASINSFIPNSFPNPAPIQQNAPTNFPTMTPIMVQ